jgi:hypothetical protein
LSVTVKYVGGQIENVQRKGETETHPSARFTVDQVRSYKPIFGWLNDKDRDILYLIFVSGKKQKDVQRILERSQPSLCYDIKRIRKRLQFIFYLNNVFDLFVNFVHEFREYFSPQEMDILILMFYTTSFTLTSRVLGLSQVKVRYSFNKCIKRMENMGVELDSQNKEALSKKWWEIYEIFVIIKSNLNIVRRVYKSSDDSLDTSLPLAL